MRLIYIWAQCHKWITVTKGGAKVHILTTLNLAFIWELCSDFLLKCITVQMLWCVLFMLHVTLKIIKRIFDRKQRKQLSSLTATCLQWALIGINHKSSQWNFVMKYYSNSWRYNCGLDAFLQRLPHTLGAISAAWHFVCWLV